LPSRGREESGDNNGDRPARPARAGDAASLEKLIRRCWAKVECGHGLILVRDGANSGWIGYMLKDQQKSEFEGLLDCIMLESLHNPSVDA
jgi:hypothetical protein